MFLKPNLPAYFNTNVRRWLFGLSGLSISMICLGGYTRLTSSGLSMTSWKLAGSLPPMTEGEWESEFQRYQEYPEYQKVNKFDLEFGMTDFKRIYYTEWGHRMLGRMIGFCLLGPSIYYGCIRRIFTGKMYLMMGSILSLGISQAFVGWWMVKSGLESNNDDSLFNELKKSNMGYVNVDPIRMSVHWLLAIALTSLTIATAAKVKPPILIKNTNYVKNWLNICMGTSFLTLSTGPLVAGYHAGLVCNTWPKMNGEEWIDSSVKHWWNKCDSPSLFFKEMNREGLQFIHRSLAYLTVGSCLSGVFLIKRFVLNKVFYLVPLFATTQLLLGVSTLLFYIPTNLALLHQLGAVTLFSWLVYLRNSI